MGWWWLNQVVLNWIQLPLKEGFWLAIYNECFTRNKDRIKGTATISRSNRAENQGQMTYRLLIDQK